MVLGAGLEKTRRERVLFWQWCNHLTELGSQSGFEENNKPSKMTLILHNREAGVAVQFHDKVDSLFYSSHILGFLVKEELVFNLSLAILINRNPGI